MGDHYVFRFDGCKVDAANLVGQYPMAIVDGGNHSGSDGGVAREEYEVRTAKRAVAIAIGQVLISEDVPFAMTIE